MIHSQPKTNTLIAVGFFIILALAADAWLLADLINDPSSYFLPKMILIPALLVIAMIVAAKSYFSALHLTLGNNQLTYRYPFSAKKKHKLSDIVSWEEKVIQRKNSTYRRLSIQLANGKKLLLSNHENGDYEKVVSYFNKKVKE